MTMTRDDEALEYCRTLLAHWLLVAASLGFVVYLSPTPLRWVKTVVSLVINERLSRGMAPVELVKVIDVENDIPPLSPLLNLIEVTHRERASDESSKFLTLRTNQEVPALEQPSRVDTSGHIRREDLSATHSKLPVWLSSEERAVDGFFRGSRLSWSVALPADERAWNSKQGVGWSPAGILVGNYGFWRLAAFKANDLDTMNVNIRALFGLKDSPRVLIGGDYGFPLSSSNESVVDYGAHRNERDEQCADTNPRRAALKAVIALVVGCTAFYLFGREPKFCNGQWCSPAVLFIGCALVMYGGFYLAKYIAEYSSEHCLAATIMMAGRAPLLLDVLSSSRPLPSSAPPRSAGGSS